MNQVIKYKANGNSGNEVKLSEGLDFKNDDNITVTTGTNGAVTHKLNTTLKILPRSLEQVIVALPRKLN